MSKEKKEEVAKKMKDTLSRIKKAGSEYSPKHALYSKEHFEKNKK